MRRQHFERLKPICPVCLGQHDQVFRLQLASVFQEQETVVTEGILLCSNSKCQREYPIIDGIPLIVSDIRSFVSDQAMHLLQREDLSEEIESMLGDCCGPGSTADTARQHLSSYIRDHYGDLDPQENDEPLPGSILRVLESGLNLIDVPCEGPVLDAGCSVGRSSFALAAQTGQLVLGIDLNIPMLRMAQRVLRNGQVCYPRRRVGLVYDRREFAVEFEQSELVDFWACDASVLPFASRQFGSVVSLNTLDCVSSPLDYLASLTRVMKLDSQLLLACPYDWSPAATSVEGWLGGHSQRGSTAGASEPILRGLLDGSHPSGVQGLKLLSETNEEWTVRLHARCSISYSTHVVAARRC